MFFLVLLLLTSFFLTIFSYIVFEYLFTPNREFSEVSEFVPRVEVRKEKLEQVAITVCEVLRDLRKRNGCYNGNPDDGWNWLGTPTISAGYYIYTGNFNSLALYPKINTFSCSQANKFGRFLFFRGLNPQHYQNTSYWIKVPQGTTDPCGVGDFVWNFYY